VKVDPTEIAMLVMLLEAAVEASLPEEVAEADGQLPRWKSSRELHQKVPENLANGFLKDAPVEETAKLPLALALPESKGYVNLAGTNSFLL
jgi:hypothetical protein